MLLLLSEQSAHGYDLLDRLKRFGFGRDPGGLYRVLRTLEREGQVVSRWEPSEVGPDRCLYSLTPLGREWLHAWADTLGETKRTVERFLYRYSVVSALDADIPPPATVTIRPDRRISLDDAPAFRSLVQSIESHSSPEDVTW